MFLVLEDVPGTTLEQYAKDRPLDARWAAQTVAAIARAVHLAHEQGITHQDLNPRNVLIDREGQPRVIDFGVAWSRPWWVETGRLRLRSAARPPTSRRNRPAGQADRIGRTTDVFGLGGILFFLLTNSPLYSGENVLAILQQAREAGLRSQPLESPRHPAAAASDLPEGAGQGARRPFRHRCRSRPGPGAIPGPRRMGYLAMLAAVFLLAFGLAWGIRSRHPAETTSAEADHPVRVANPHLEAGDRVPAAARRRSLCVRETRSRSAAECPEGSV